MGKKKKNIHGVKMPVMTKGKLVRLVLFVILAPAGFILNSYFPAMGFGWGFTFGMVCMAVLTG